MIDEQQPSSPKPQKPRGSARTIQLQQRDLAILRSLSEGRYLTVEAIEWLHYPSWRERYRSFLERQKLDASLTYYPLNHVYRRLVAMRAGEAPLVYRLTRTHERARLIYTRLADAYVLAEAGADLLCTRQGDELADLWYEDPRKRSIKNFEHSVAIGTLYAALRAALEFRGQQLTDWRGDHLLALRDPVGGGASYDRLAVTWVGKEGKLRSEELPVLPDATFTLGGVRHFVEVDLGTTNLESWDKKVRAYEAYRHSAKLRSRYATDSFTVLVVAPTEVRLRRIAEEVLKVCRQPNPAYLLTTADKIHPTRFRANWRAIAGAQWSTRRVVDRLIELPDKIQFAAVALWKNADA